MDFFTSDQDLDSGNSLFTDGETAGQGQFFSNDYDVVPIYSEEEASEINTVSVAQQDIIGEPAQDSEEIIVVLQEIKDILVSSNEHMGESETEGSEEATGTDNDRTDSRTDTDGIDSQRSGTDTEGTGETVIEGETESTTLDQTLQEISQKLDSIYNCQLEQSKIIGISNSNSVLFYQVNVALLSFILGGVVAHSFLGKIR